MITKYKYDQLNNVFSFQRQGSYLKYLHTDYHIFYRNFSWNNS
jgi:hypothetical protein